LKEAIAAFGGAVATYEAGGVADDAAETKDHLAHAEKLLSEQLAKLAADARVAGKG
jgi:hypothetical protein